MQIVRIDISGNITSRSAHIYKDIFSYAEASRRVSAVVIAVNSGGGDAASSEILSNSVLSLKKKKPVYAVIEGIGASGAYWIASASTKVYAMSTSVVGSIGVIGINPNFKSLLDRIGVKVEITKIGKYKDMMSPFSPVSDEAREKYLAVLEQIYSSFTRSVSANRKLDPTSMERISTGEIFSAPDALKLGLIDKIGTFEEAINDISSAYGLKAKYKTLAPRRSFIERILTSNSASEILTRWLFD